MFEEFRVISMFDLLKEYFDQGRITVDPGIHTELATVHDPCNYVRKSQKAFGVHYGETIRWLAAKCCPNLVEMCVDPLNNYCCGNGGGAQVMPYEAERLKHGQYKAEQIKATGAELVISPCHNCRDQILKFLGKHCDMGKYRTTKYLWEVIADSLIYEPWSPAEIQAAHQARDEQFARFEVVLEEV
ncbi:MAG: (Fe-S)-binding protein [Deltaproteobacteria bacterium]|nr:(Fe-S)-binding protein [Deltaproteobacteria bacterium]